MGSGNKRPNTWTVSPNVKRDAAIVAAYKAGDVSFGSLGRMYGLSATRIMQIVYTARRKAG
jgi:hypothetical protein